ncbi:unnamed protein product [Withania somnifera]
MAEVLLVVQGVLRKVLPLAAEEISSLWGLKQDLQVLAEKLEMIQALLSDAERKHLTSRVVQLWIKKLEGVATEADDALDESAYVVLQRKIEGSLDKVLHFFSPSNSLLFHVEMARMIKKINRSLEEVHKSARDMGLRPVEVINPSVTLREIRQTDPFVDDSQIIGRKNDIGEIVSMLTSSNSGTGLPVISIVGMPGQGKTTLAQLVYKNEKVLRHFDKRLWVCVSDDFMVERILNEMFQSLTQTNFELTNREAIVKKLQGHLKGQRYFLVLDDVWNENPDKWDSMRKCLLEIGGSMGSKILVTTRSDAVTLAVQASHSHRLQVLSREDSWTLFKKIAFADGGAIENSALVSIGRRIVEKCKGLPLAIKALAGLLYSQKEESEWLVIEHSELWGSLESTDTVLPSLRLSYDHLPLLSLKQCFTYCSIFLKDSVMEKEKLVQLWIAQGLIEPSQGSRLEMEDTGNNFFNVLLRSSFLQDAKRDEYDSIMSCTMHDLVHDLALHISKGYCLTVNVDEKTKDEIQATHLLMVSYERKMIEIMQEIASRLRTLHLIGVSLGDMLTGFKYLRVLILDNFYVMKLPRWIGKLKHLRYLDIQKTSITRLPDSITKLYNLQTLRVNALEEMPNKFQNLIKLRHFYMKDNIHTRKNCMLSGIGQLVCLQTLPFFVVSRKRRCLIEELGGLRDLKGEVKIYGLENILNGEESRRANLSAKVKIHNLELHWNTRNQECNDTDVLEGLKPHTNLKGLTMRNFEGSKFPTWMVTSEHSMLLRNLVKIRLDNCNKCKQIPTLGHLPNLKIVLIRKLHNVKWIGKDFYGMKNPGDSTNGSALIAFPALQEFTLSGMSTLIGWSHAIPSVANVFPQLDRFIVEDCPELDNLPNFKSLQSLRQLTISMCKKLSRLPDWLQALSALEILKISGCSNLRSIPALSKLQSLQNMSITSCDKLSNLPAGLEACISLEWLNIQFCPVLQPEGLQWLSGLKELEIGYFSDDLVDFPFPNISDVNYSESSNTNDHTQQPCFSIHSLKLYGWKRVRCLPAQIQHLLGLRVLTLWGFEGLEALPGWLGNLSSLQVLELYHCKNLKYLPSLQAMQNLTNLRELEIFGCHLLHERCAYGKRPEWHKIAHIPIVQANYQSLRPR